MERQASPTTTSPSSNPGFEEPAQRTVEICVGSQLQDIGPRILEDLKQARPAGVSLAPVSIPHCPVSRVDHSEPTTLRVSDSDSAGIGKSSLTRIYGKHDDQLMSSAHGRQGVSLLERRLEIGQEEDKAAGDTRRREEGPERV